MSNRDRYEQARRLIESGQLQEARDLLLPIRHEDRAAYWIQKIDAHLAKMKGGEQRAKAGRRALSCGTTALVVLLAVLAFIAGLAVGGYALDLNPEPTPVPVQVVAVVTATPPPTDEPTSSEKTSTAVVQTNVAIQSQYDATLTALARIDEATQTAFPYTETPVGKWVFDSFVSALDDSATYIIGLPAEDSVGAWLSNPTPLLTIRCRKGDYDVFIDADTQLDSTLDNQVYTRVRYGDNPSIYVMMGESTTGEAMFFPDGEAAVRNLLTANRLVVGFTPFNASPVEAIFDLTGIQTAIQPLFDVCGRP